MSRSTLATSKGTIAYVRHGDGDPVFLWPSLFSDHRLYDETIEPLVAAGWQTIAIDGPGFGRSSPPRGTVQPAEYADLVIEIAGAFDLPLFAFAGTSWGGQIGAHLGARHPDRLTGLLLMNTPLKVSRGGHLAELWLTRIFGNTRLAANGVARSMLSAETMRDHPERAERFKAAFADFDKRAAAQTVDTTLRRSEGLKRILPALEVRTTLMFGAHDPLYSDDDLVPTARLAPNAAVVVVPNCGHLIPLEAPEAAVDALGRLHAPS